MQNAHHDESTAGVTREGDAIIPGIFPSRNDTVMAELLARLLAGECLTSSDASIKALTTRLPAVMHALVKDYRWPIQKTRIAKGCLDGRVALVAGYSLHGDALAIALDAGAAYWCREVRAAREGKRKGAKQAQAKAARFNAAARPSRLLGGGVVSDHGQTPPTGLGSIWSPSHALPAPALLPKDAYEAP